MQGREQFNESVWAASIVDNAHERVRRVGMYYDPTFVGRQADEGSVIINSAGWHICAADFNASFMSSNNTSPIVQDPEWVLA